MLEEGGAIEGIEASEGVVALGSWICFFGAAYGISLVAFRSWKKARRKRHEAASSCISIIHGTAAAAISAYDAFSAAGWKWNLASPNTYLQSSVMDFSVAYFLVDLAHYALFAPDDYLFILHHVATSSYMLSCRYWVRHGAGSVMAMLAVGEATSPFQNIWTICRMGRDRSPVMNKIYEVLSPIFTVVFTIFRVILGPALVWKLSKFYFSGGADGTIPRWLVYFWMGKSSLALVGSLVWVYKLWAGLLRFYRRKNKASAASAKLLEEEGEDKKRVEFAMNRLDKED